VKKLTFKLEFITPAFIGGANQQAELRPASFVGLLRWWWRALKGECNIENLREEEVKIFGGIAKNLRKEEIKMASPVYLR
jgi:CRISPR-associated protein Cmr1